LTIVDFASYQIGNFVEIDHTSPRIDRDIETTQERIGQQLKHPATMIWHEDMNISIICDVTREHLIESWHIQQTVRYHHSPPYTTIIADRNPLSSSKCLNRKILNWQERDVYHFGLLWFFDPYLYASQLWGYQSRKWGFPLLEVFASTA
jgi:hypothetical protein